MIKIAAETHCPRSISQDRCVIENPLPIRVSGVFCTTKQSYLRLKSLLHKIPFESVLLQSTSTDMPSSLSFARTNSRSLELPFLTISNFDGASSVKVESGIKRSFMQ
jgi:hypothetical protein